MAQGNFFSELKRRNVYRVGVAYALAAFALIEIVSNVAPMFDLPGWIGRGVVLLLIVGFPAALAFSWIYEITPEGLKRTDDVVENASITRYTAHRLNVVTIVLVLLLAGLYGADRFLPGREAAEAGNRAGPKDGSISIAVLPFLNLSSDKEQEFFSDGMTEEITSALAKVKGLQVVGRTSAFEFKGQNKDLHAIGLALRASYLLEGSVRKAGNRVRITGQLIRADNGTHIWTANYDRELTDIFRTQDDIAQAIASALQVPLGLKSDETLVTGRTADADIHEDYLRAKAVYRARVVSGAVGLQTISAMEALVLRDPNYAPAWALLATAYAGQPSVTIPLPSADELRQAADTYLPKAEIAGRRAIALDPRSADSYVGLGLAMQSRGKYQEAEELYKKGLAIDPYNPDLLHFYAQALQFNGRTKAAVEIRERLLALDPLAPNSNFWAATLFFDAGQYEPALALLKTVPAARVTRLEFLLLNDAALGRPADAADAILAAPAGQVPPEEVAAAVKLLRSPQPAVLPRDLPVFGRLLYPVYFYVGAPERAFDFHAKMAENQIAGGYVYPRAVLWAPMFAPERKTQRFKALVRKTGLPEYWRARGWPDVCHPVGADDFECR